MHTEHKTLKWCAVVLALIISIATIAGMFYLPVPGYLQLHEEGSVITRAPEEIVGLICDYDPEVLEQEMSDAENTEQVDQGKELSVFFAPVDITVKADGLTMELMSAPVTVAEMLNTYGIHVGKDDIVEPSLDEQLTEGAEVIIQRITFDEITVSEEVPFKVKVKETDQLPAKTKKVVQKGVKGEDEVTYKVTYADGKEIERKEIDRERVKEPVTKIVEKSTVGLINGKEYSRKFTVKAYSYTGGGRTASGLPAAVGRIAVDPRVIPLGTRVYVEGYGFATAADTGGNIKGKTIDVYYNSAGQCRSWGCRNVTIYILK